MQVPQTPLRGFAKPLCIGSNPIGASWLIVLGLPSDSSLEKLAEFSGSV